MQQVLQLLATILHSTVQPTYVTDARCVSRMQPHLALPFLFENLEARPCQLYLLL